MNAQNRAYVTNRRYIDMDINAKINGRQNRNKLNYSNPFATYYFTVMQFGTAAVNTANPTVNNGLYHAIGKNHSQYKSN